MSPAQLIRILQWAWIVFGVYWLLAARRTKAARTTESPIYRVFRLLLLVITFTLLFAKWAGVGFLGRAFFCKRNLSHTSDSRFALAGLAIAIWARMSLGQFWSDKIVLKIDHQLVRSGPYARMRHPIYSGVLLGVAGSALLIAEWRGPLAFLLLLANYTIKARREDKLLGEAFGKDFADHSKRAGFLLPRCLPKR